MTRRHKKLEREDGSAGFGDGAGGGGGDGEGDLQGFGQFAGGHYLETPFVDAGLMKLQNRNGGDGVDGLTAFKLVEGIKGDNDGLALERVEATFAFDKRSAADQRQLAALEPDRNRASSLLAFLAATDGMAAFAGAEAATNAFGGASIGFGKAG